MTITETFSNHFHWVPVGFRPQREKQDTLSHQRLSSYALQRKLCQWQAIRRLQSMDDESLQDIGIERYEIREFVEKTCC